MLAQLLNLLKTSPQEVTPKQLSDRLAVATSVILLEIAAADEEYAEDERLHIIETLRTRFDLSAEDAHELLAMAHQERASSRDLFRFTRIINEACTADEKLRIVEEVWRVIYADGQLDAHEDHLAHRLGRLLNLSHPSLINAKINAKKERA